MGLGIIPCPEGLGGGIGKSLGARGVPVRTKGGWGSLLREFMRHRPAVGG
jgi:hypothetical protein